MISGMLERTVDAAASLLEAPVLVPAPASRAAESMDLGVGMIKSESTRLEGAEWRILFRSPRLVPA